MNMIRLVSRSVLEHESYTDKQTQTYTENLQIEQGSFFDLGEAIERRQSLKIADHYKDLRHSLEVSYRYHNIRD